MKRADIIFRIIGSIFMIFGILAIFNALYFQNPVQVFWMCYLGILIIGMGMLRKNSYLMMTQLNILTTPHIIWIIDFIYFLSTGNSLWGVTDYFFLEERFNLGKLISLQHLFTVPLSLVYITKLGIKRADSWKWSFAQITLTYLAVSILTPPDLNINCVFDPCINLWLGLPYRLTWFIVFFSITLITSLILHYLIENKFKKSTS